MGVLIFFFGFRGFCLFTSVLTKLVKKKKKKMNGCIDTDCSFSLGDSECYGLHTRKKGAADFNLNTLRALRVHLQVSVHLVKA